MFMTVQGSLVGIVKGILNALRSRDEAPSIAQLARRDSGTCYIL